MSDVPLREVIPKLSTPRGYIYVLVCLLFSVGAHFFIRSNLGTDPLGVLRHLPLTIGICQAAVALLCITAWAVWNRRRPVLSPYSPEKYRRVPA